MARSPNWSPPQEEQHNSDHDSDDDSLTYSTDSEHASYSKQPTREANSSPSEFSSPASEQAPSTHLITSPAYSTDSNTTPYEPSSPVYDPTLDHWPQGDNCSSQGSLE